MKLRGLIVVEDGIQSQRSNGYVRGQALERIANRPIVEHVFEALCRAGVEEILVASSSAVSEDVRDCLRTREQRADPPLRYLQTHAPFQLADALRIAAAVVGDDPCIVHLATGLLDERLPSFADQISDAPDIMLLVHHSPRDDEHLSAATQGMLHVAALSAEHALGMAGVWLFGRGAFQLAAATPWRPGRDVDLTTLGDRVATAGGAIHVKLADTWRQYRGDPLDLLELNRIVLDRLDSSLRRSSTNGNRIEGRVFIDEAASVRSSVIVGPTVIGPGAQISDAYIGPYTSIDEGARVEGAEVERSIISAGASVTHVGGRLVSSVVGRDARVFRDFSLPRAFRLRVGDGTEVALC